MPYHTFILVAFLSWVSSNTTDASPYQNHPCGPLRHQNVAGPWDYRSPNFSWNINDINRFHFLLAKREMEKAAPNSRYVHAQLSYTLIRSPNHHKALNLLASLHKKFPAEAFNPPAYGTIPVTPECFFDRAIRFVRDDVYVWLIKGIYYHKMGKYEVSLSAYNHLLEKHPKWGELHYNFGLLYMDMDDYDKALFHAKMAYEYNYALPGLKNRLKKKGKWR